MQKTSDTEKESKYIDTKNATNKNTVPPKT